MTSRAAYDERFLDQLAEHLLRRGWRLPALMALETGRPLAFVGGQLVWLGQPLLNLLFPPEDVSRVARLLEEPEAVGALIARLQTQDSA
jgi:hypothetical protein